MLTVAVTCTVPASCVGDTAVHWVEEAQLTLLETAAPNLILVAVAPRPKPLPVTVTAVPPGLGPLPGLRLVTVGVNL